MSKTLTAVLGVSAKQIILERATQAAKEGHLTQEQLQRIQDICEGHLPASASLVADLESLLPGITEEVAQGLNMTVEQLMSAYEAHSADELLVAIREDE